MSDPWREPPPAGSGSRPTAKPAAGSSSAPEEEWLRFEQLPELFDVLHVAVGPAVDAAVLAADGADPLSTKVSAREI